MAALKQYESGGKVAEICRTMGISQATSYGWKNQYAGMGVHKPVRKSGVSSLE